MIGSGSASGVVEAAGHDVQLVGTSGMAIGSGDPQWPQKLRVTSAEEWYWVGPPRVISNAVVTAKVA